MITLLLLLLLLLLSTIILLEKIGNFPEIITGNFPEKYETVWENFPTPHH